MTEPYRCPACAEPIQTGLPTCPHCSEPVASHGSAGAPAAGNPGSPVYPGHPAYQAGPPAHPGHPPPPPPTMRAGATVDIPKLHKKCRQKTRGVGVFNIVIGGIGLLGLVAMAVSPPASRDPAVADQVFVVGVVIGAIITLPFIGIGVFAVMLRRWAVIASMPFYALFLLGGIASFNPCPVIFFGVALLEATSILSTHGKLAQFGVDPRFPLGAPPEVSAFD